MSSIEPTLKFMRTQLQLELAEIAADIVRVGRISAEAERAVDALTQQCSDAACELRIAMSRTSINPPLVVTLRTLATAEQQALQEAQRRLEAARRKEQEVRAALAQVRKRDQSLEGALRSVARNRLQQQQTSEMALGDDLWLQHSWMIAR